MMEGDTVMKVEGEGASHQTSSNMVTSSQPRSLLLLKKWWLQMLLLALVVVTVVVVPIVLLSPSQGHSVPANRVPCPNGVNKEECEMMGCVWDPWGGDVPSCFFPPPSVHGYTITSIDNSTAGLTVALLGLKKTSAAVVPNMKETLRLEVTGHGPQILRVKVSVPGEERYEPPVPLQLPPTGAEHQHEALYRVVLGEEGGDFSLVVHRADGEVIFDTSVGGFTFADQFLQVATMLASENLYGLGESHHESFRHDLHYRVWPMFARDQPPGPPGENLYGVHPVYMVLQDSGQAHMVLWLNSNAMEAVTLPLPGLALRSIGGIMDLYFFLGPSPSEALQQYVATVGLPVMPAYWALGFQLCRYGYNSLDNLKTAVTRTRRHGIPQDVQYADIDHMDRRLDFTVDPISFQGLEEYMQTVKKEGLRFIIILDPAINAELEPAKYPVHQRAMEQDVYIKWPKDMVPADNFGAGDVVLGYVWPDNRTAFPDFLRTSARTWWKDEINRLYKDKGVHFDGLWIDMNEPANFGTNEEKPWNWPEGREPWSLTCPSTTLEDPPYPSAAVTVYGQDKRLSDKTLCMEVRQGENLEHRHYDVHNLYGWSQSQPTLEALHATTQQRGIVITRSTFPSSGRWAGHWLGDNSARWLDMHKSIIGTMEFNLFGIPYVGADICGFFGDTTEELCARWMELGAFYPYSRNHNTLGAIDHDPGLWPSVAASSRAALRLRYTLLPYLYTLHHLASTQGYSVVRPLFFEFPDTRAAWDIDDQFLWGAWLMVAPVLDQGLVSRGVYFPPGAWFDYHTGLMIEDTGATHDAEAPLGHMLLYVRGGGILVTQRPRANTMLSRTEPLGLVVAPSENTTAKGFFYWDDGEAIDPVSGGQYYTANVTYEQDIIHWKVVHASAVAEGLVLSDVRVFGVTSRPRQLLVNGSRWTAGDWHYDDSLKTLFLYDLQLPIISNFALSWSTKMDFLLPCPLSYKGRTDASPVTQSECAARNCVWNPANEVQCSIPPPDSYGLEFVDGIITNTNKGFRTRLRPHGTPLYPGRPNEIIFEAFQYANHMLRVKFFVADGSRYEVPVPLSLPSEEVLDPLYKVVLPDNPAPGQMFFFYVMRQDSGTILFDTRIGGLTFTDQFLSISTVLPSKNVYGLGENAHDSFRHAMDGSVWPIFGRDQGPVPQAGKQVNLYGSHPFYECVENDGQTHGVLLLNSNAMDYQLLDYPALTFRTIGGVLDLFLMAGPEPESVVAQYTSLIHRPVMPPYWALGFQLCRYGFETLQDLQAAVNRTKEAGIPLDVVYGDIDYMDRRMDFTVDPVKYEGFGEYVQQIQQEGRRFIVILDPAINVELPAEEYPTHQRAMTAGAYITWPEDTDPAVISANNNGMDRIMLGYVWPDNKTAFPNFFSQAAQDWWIHEIGIFYNESVKFDGLWIDMNEPANFGTNEAQPWNWPEGREPWSLSCPNTRWDNPPYITKAAAEGPTHTMADKTLCLAAEEKPYKHYDVHNLYGWAQTEPTLRAIQGLTGQRGIVVTRSTFPGSGRWAGHWLGDNRSNWTDMAHSVIGMMEFNLFGIPYVGADICGFFGDTTEELCERWMEVGAFYPYSRNHNTKGAKDQDPGIWGEQVINSSRRALEVRYRLLPYLYTLFYEAHTSGTTVVRPLFHEFPSNRHTLDVDDQFLWGAAFMVSPVLTPATTQRWVYFPQDAWYDYYTGAPVEFPGDRMIVQAPRDTIPLHIRGGNILPTQRPAQNTATARQNPMGLIIAIGWDRKAHGQLFWDDGKGINTVAEKKYSLVKFSFVQHTLTATVQTNTHKNLGELTLADLEFLGVEKPPSQIIFLNSKVPEANITYEQASMRLRMQVQHQMNVDFTLTLKDIWFYDVSVSRVVQ